MKTIVLAAAIGLALPAIALAQTASLEVTGFPLTLHQAQVIGFSDIREERAAPIADKSGLGFPASPMQTLVLMPRAMASEEVAVDPPERQIRSGGALLRTSAPSR
jgi:hypothetical protein